MTTLPTSQEKYEEAVETLIAVAEDQGFRMGDGGQRAELALATIRSTRVVVVNSKSQERRIQAQTEGDGAFYIPKHQVDLHVERALSAEREKATKLVEALEDARLAMLKLIPVVNRQNPTTAEAMGLCIDKYDRVLAEWKGER